MPNQYVELGGSSELDRSQPPDREEVLSASASRLGNRTIAMTNTSMRALIQKTQLCLRSYQASPARVRGLDGVDRCGQARIVGVA